MAVTQQQLQSLQSQLQHFIGPAAMLGAVQAAPAAPAAAVDPSQFCTIWDDARPVLNVLQTFFNVFPGLGWVGTILAGLIAAGDAAKKAICG